MPPLQLTLLAFLYLVGFGLLHSLLATNRVKATSRRVLGRGFAFYRLGYVLLQVACLTGFILLFRPSDVTLYRMPVPWTAAALVIKGLAVGLVVWCLIFAFDGLEFIGVRQIAALWGGRPPETDIPLRTTGPYGWCRHPVYLATFVYFAVSPRMTILLAVFTVFVLLYGLVGSIPEERRLLGQYGPAYADYQRRTKRVIPFIA